MNIDQQNYLSKLIYGVRNKKDREQQELNEAPTTPVVFLDSYNQNIPAGFPRATLAKLREFQELHPNLFKQKEGWSVAKHRKRLMDWLSSQV